MYTQYNVFVLRETFSIQIALITLCFCKIAQTMWLVFLTAFDGLRGAGPQIPRRIVVFLWIYKNKECFKIIHVFCGVFVYLWYKWSMLHRVIKVINHITLAHHRSLLAVFNWNYVQRMPRQWLFRQTESRTDRPFAISWRGYESQDLTLYL